MQSLNVATHEGDNHENCDAVHRKRSYRHPHLSRFRNRAGSAEKAGSQGYRAVRAYEIPLELAKVRYGGHFSTVVNDLHESDDLRVLDYNGERAFALFRLDELKSPVFYEPEAAAA
jgi:hypothetical protein